MASRLLRSKRLQNLRFSSTSTPVPQFLTLTPKSDPCPETGSRCSDSPVDLSDHARLFSRLSTSELLRSCAVLYAAAIGPMVELGTWAMESRLMRLGLTRAAVLGLVRKTFYEHFCAGQDAAEASRRVEKMHEATGLRGMPFYSVEHTDDAEECEKNLKRFIETVETTRWLPQSAASFGVVKITAICPTRVLKKVSDLLRWQHRDPSFHLPWKRKAFPLFGELSPLYHTVTQPEPLTLQEERDLELAHQRLLALCEKCLESNMPLLVDAEDTALQPGIDYLTYASAIMCDKRGDLPIVYNTIQAYLKDSKERLHLALKAMEKEGVQMGFKLVRGAYMSSETRLANSLGYDSPIHNSIEATHRCYNDCASLLLEKINRASGTGVVLASHNVESGKLAVMKARELGIDGGNPRLEFAQLYGMADALSFGLRNAGFNVSKYMPYGPVDVAMPYLLRRAEENRGLLSTSLLDRQLMMKEFKRRLKSALI